MLRSSNLAPGTLLPLGASKDNWCSHTCRTNAPPAPTSSHQRRCPELRNSARLEPTIATKNPWYQVANFYIAPMNFFHAFLLISNCDHCWSLQGRRAQLYIHTTRACVHIFATRISQQICGSALAAVVFVALYIRFACLLVCLFACRRKRNDRTRRGPMQRGATLPLPSRWPSTKGCSNTCGQPHWAPPRASGQIHWAYCEHRSSYASPPPPPRVATTATGAPNRLTSKSRLTSESRLTFGKRAPDLHVAPNLHKGRHSPKHNTICCCRCCCCCCCCS